VSTPAPTLPQSAYWHQVWLTPDVRQYVARSLANRMEPLPLYTSDDGSHDNPRARWVVPKRERRRTGG
jgi:hypothetical protein